MIVSSFLDSIKFYYNIVKQTFFKFNIKLVFILDLIAA